MDLIWIEILLMTVASTLLHPLSCLRFLIMENGCSVGKMFTELNSLWRIWENTNGDIILLYTKQNTDRMLKSDWLRASPYTCVRTGIWTGWTSVHNNKGKHWLSVVLLVWVYNKALINLEFGPYGKYLLWRHAARTSLRSVHTAWRHNKYFRVWTTLSVNKSVLFKFQQCCERNLSLHE